MKLPWIESSPVVPILFWVSIGLLAYAPFKAGLISFSDIEDNKDLVDTISTIIGLIALLLGATLSYIRFFKGRILKPKIDLDIRAECFSYRYTNLYSLEVLISNRGSVSLWNYDIKITVRPYPLSRDIDISESLIRSKNPFSEKLVDVGETSFEHTVVELDKIPLAYTFEVIVIGDANKMWRRCLTMNNP